LLTSFDLLNVLSKFTNHHILQSEDIMIIGIDCRAKRDANGELWVRFAPVIKDADKRQRASAAAVIIGAITLVTLLTIAMCATDVAGKDAGFVDVTPKYGVQP
jgi:hypothetical protein